MKTITIFLLILLISCTQQSISYESAMQNCMKNADISEFTIVDTGKKGKTIRNVPKECIIGAQLPKFSAITNENIKIDHEYLNGKINIINFWFKACKPCVAKIPTLNELMEVYGTDQINYTSITKDSAHILNSYLEKNPFLFRHIPDSKFLIQDTFGLIWGYPFTLVTDKNLKIIHIMSREKEKGISIRDHAFKELEPILLKHMD